MDDVTRALNWLTENDDSFDVERSRADAGGLRRLYNEYDTHNNLRDAKFVECVTLVRTLKAMLLVVRALS